MAKSNFKVLKDGWVGGRRVAEGETISLTEAEAKYEPADMIAATTPDQAPAKARGKGDDTP